MLYTKVYFTDINKSINYMYKPIFNKRSVVKFTHFSNRGYSLFAVLGKEVIIGVLSVATLQHATAHNTSNDALKVSEIGRAHV